jgi:hypothetical protein
MWRVGLFVMILGMSSLVNGADAPSVWLPRVTTTKVVTKSVLKTTVGGCAGGVCSLQKSKEVVQTRNRVSRFRVWR